MWLEAGSHATENIGTTDGQKLVAEGAPGRVAGPGISSSLVPRHRLGAFVMLVAVEQELQPALHRRQRE